MNHRHLLPNEIDLLVDGEVGFGVAPLRAHVRECAECQARLDEAQSVAQALEHLPHFAPSPLFADRVMAQVQVFEPWQVAAADSARRLVPRSRPARAVALALGGSVAALLTAAVLWLGARFDLLVFFSGVAVDRGRQMALGALRDAAVSTFGSAAVTLVQSNGVAGVAVALAMFAAISAVALAGLRSMALASGGRR